MCVTLGSLQDIILNDIENGRANAPSDRGVSLTTSRYDATLWSIDTEPPLTMMVILNALQYNG